MVDEAAEESTRTGTGDEVGMKALGGAAVEAEAALTTEGTLEEYRLANGAGEKPRLRGNPATVGEVGGKVGGKVAVDVEEDVGRVNCASSLQYHPSTLDSRL